MGILKDIANTLDQSTLGKVWGTFNKTFSALDNERDREDGTTVFDLVPEIRVFAGGAEITKDVDSVNVEYHDSGSGIPEKYLSHLFTRFFRIPERSINVHGTGLGLSICKHIIESHNGTISVSSPQGSGVVFTIKLPKGDEIIG